MLLEPVGRTIRLSRVRSSMSQVTSSRGTKDRRSLADLEENASRRMGPGIAGHVRGPRFCGAGCPVAPFFGSIHDDDTRSSESSLQDPNLFDQVCTGHLASARFDRHHHWPSCHVGSPWPHSRFCASCSLTWRAIFPQPIFHSISPSSSQSSLLLTHLPSWYPLPPLW